MKSRNITILLLSIFLLSCSNNPPATNSPTTNTPIPIPTPQATNSPTTGPNKPSLKGSWATTCYKDTGVIYYKETVVFTDTSYTTISGNYKDAGCSTFFYDDGKLTTSLPSQYRLGDLLVGSTDSYHFDYTSRTSTFPDNVWTYTTLKIENDKITWRGGAGTAYTRISSQ